MNTTAKQIFWIMHVYALRAAEVYEYTNWSDAFATEHLRGIPEKFVKAYFDKGGEAFKKAHFAEMEPEIRNTILGNFDGKLRLIPLWLKPFIDPEEEVRAINLADYSAHTLLKKIELGVYDALPKEYRDIVKEFGNTFAVKQAMEGGASAKYIMEAFNQQMTTHMEEKLNENPQNN